MYIYINIYTYIYRRQRIHNKGIQIYFRTSRLQTRRTNSNSELKFSITQSQISALRTDFEPDVQSIWILSEYVSCANEPYQNTAQRSWFRETAQRDTRCFKGRAWMYVYVCIHIYFHLCIQITQWVQRAHLRGCVCHKGLCMPWGGTDE